MAVIKNNEIKKMNEEERLKKLEELKMELIKKNVHANKSGKIRTKEIKKAIARILTIGVSKKAVTKKKAVKTANKNNKNNTHK